MAGQSAFDPKNIVKEPGGKDGLLEELNLPPKLIAFLRENARILQISIVMITTGKIKRIRRRLLLPPR